MRACACCVCIMRARLLLRFCCCCYCCRNYLSLWLWHRNDLACSANTQIVDLCIVFTACCSTVPSLVVHIERVFCYLAANRAQDLRTPIMARRGGRSVRFLPPAEQCADIRFAAIKIHAHIHTQQCERHPTIGLAFRQRLFDRLIIHFDVGQCISWWDYSGDWRLYGARLKGLRSGWSCAYSNRAIGAIHVVFVEQ